MRFLSPFLIKKKILKKNFKKKKKNRGKILILIFFNFSLLQWVQGFQALILVIKRWSAAESFSIFENHVHMSKKNLMFAHFFVTFLALNLTAMP